MGYRALIGFDMDNTLNYRSFDLSEGVDEEIVRKNPEHFYISPHRKGLPLGSDPLDFVTQNREFLQIMFDILHKNNVLCVVGSQRIQMDGNEAQARDEMYAGLNAMFGLDRPYLDEQVAREIGQELQGQKLGHSKNVLLAAYQKKYGLPAENIFLVDDDQVYQSAAEKAGHQFVHADRKGVEAGSPKENDYVNETLLRTVSVSAIEKTLKDSKFPRKIKKQFIAQFNAYKRANQEKVATWQQNLPPEGKASAPVEQEKKAESSNSFAAKGAWLGTRIGMGIALVLMLGFSITPFGAGALAVVAFVGLMAVGGTGVFGLLGSAIDKMTQKVVPEQPRPNPLSRLSVGAESHPSPQGEKDEPQEARSYPPVLGNAVRENLSTVKDPDPSNAAELESTFRC